MDCVADPSADADLKESCKAINFFYGVTTRHTLVSAPAVKLDGFPRRSTARRCLRVSAKACEG
jgi:hypothetical protein